MSGPRTAAGRAFRLSWAPPIDPSTFDTESAYIAAEAFRAALDEDIVRIEAEARAAVLADLRRGVEGVRAGLTTHTCWDDHDGPDGSHADGLPCLDKPEDMVSRAAVLALIDAAERPT
jgi:hypothetical protein